jgi:hypothetical protein
MAGLYITISFYCSIGLKHNAKHILQDIQILSSIKDLVYVISMTFRAEVSVLICVILELKCLML